MKNTDELKEFLTELKSKIHNLPNGSAEMSVMAFLTKYSEKEARFNYPCYRINLKTSDIKEYIETLLNKAESSISKTSEIKEFNYSNNKITIDFIDLNLDNGNSSKIKNCLSQLAISNTENVSLAKKYANCLAIYTKLEDKDVYLFCKGTPFVKCKQFIFSIDDSGTAKPVKYDLKFPLSLSACIFDNEVYLFSNLIESVFGLENSLKEQMIEAMNDIKSANLFSKDSIAALESYSLKGKNYYCYNNYDKRKLIALKSENKYAQNFLKKYNIQKNSQGDLLLDSEDKQKIISKFLCNDLKRDYIDIDQIYNAPGNEIID